MKWRYLVSVAKITPYSELQKELDRRSEDGWELVAIIPLPPGDAWNQIVFKRPANPIGSN